MKLKRAFTLVETAIAMTFVAILLISVFTIINRMTSIYQKTATYRSVNAAGREVIDDISRFVGASVVPNRAKMCSSLSGEYYTACVNDGAYNFVYHQFYSGDFAVNGKMPDEDVPTSGVFCTGRYTYLWNTGYVLNPKNTEAVSYRANFTYTIGGENETSISDFRLIRVVDVGSKLCASNLSGATYSITKAANDVSYRANLAEAPVELLGDSEVSLALFDFRAYRPARHTSSGHAFFSGSFILATLQGDVDITATGDYCSIPEGYISEFSYCAINKFNFAARAIGETDE